MALVDVHNTAGEKVSQVEVSDDIFNVAVKGSVLHDVVKMQLACRRSGTAAVKNRAAIKGSTKKLFRQKGTGNARSGSIKSPLKRGGGVIFGPVPRSYAYKLPKKVRRLALKMALSSKLQSESLMVLDSFELENVKTKQFADVIKTLGAEKSLIVIDGKNRNLELSAKNVPGTKVMSCDGLNVYDILKYDKLVLVQSSVEKVEGRFV